MISSQSLVGTSHSRPLWRWPVGSFSGWSQKIAIGSLRIFYFVSPELPSKALTLAWRSGLQPRNVRWSKHLMSGTVNAVSKRHTKPLSWLLPCRLCLMNLTLDKLEKSRQHKPDALHIWLVFFRRRSRVNSYWSMYIQVSRHSLFENCCFA